VEPLVTCSSAQVIIESVKLAEDESGDLIVRLYEATGGRADCRLSMAAKAEKIYLTNFLEQPTDSPPVAGDSGIDLQLRPFQVLTVRVAGLKF
jgi:alpha-mannosidase